MQATCVVNSSSITIFACVQVICIHTVLYVQVFTYLFSYMIDWYNLPILMPPKKYATFALFQQNFALEIADS